MVYFSGLLYLRMTTVHDCMVLLRKMQGELEGENKKIKALQYEKLVEAERRKELDRLKKVQLATREMLRTSTIARELAKVGLSVNTLKLGKPQVTVGL